MTEQDPLNRELLTEGDYVTDEPIDLTNCEKEPIHIPGYIQPHGVLIAINPSVHITLRWRDLYPEAKK